MNNLFHVIVCGIIFNAKNQILLCRRKPDKKLGGFWEFPGGKLEPGEALDDALKREIREELGIDVAKIKLLFVKPHQYDHGNVLLMFYICRYQSGHLQPVDHDEVKWLTAEELEKQENLLPANEEVLKMLKGMYSV